MSTEVMDRRAFMRRSGAATLGAVGTIAAANQADRLPVDRVRADGLIDWDSHNEWAENTAFSPVRGMEAVVTTVTGFFGTDRDLSGFTGGGALIAAIEEDIVTNQSADERVMTPIENHIKGSENIALSKGKAELLTAMNDGAERSDAEQAMMAAIDDYYSTIQENVITHSNSQNRQVNHMFEQLQTNDETVRSDLFGDDPPEEDLFGLLEDTYEYELLNGEAVEYEIFSYVHHNRGFSGTGTRVSDVQSTDLQREYGLDQETTPYDILEGSNSEDERDYSYGPVKSSEGNVVDSGRYVDALDSIADARDNVYSTLSGFAEDVYNAYDPGDIPTEDLVDPITAFTELAQDYDGEQGQMAYASLLGIPTTAEASVWMGVIDGELEDYFDASEYDGAETIDDLDEEQLSQLVADTPSTEIEADIYTSHVPTDGDGNEVGFEVGNWYDPTDWDEPLYIAYTLILENSDGEIEEESDFVQLENEFVITAAEDQDGNEIDSFENRSTTAQTADIDELEAELEALREEQRRLQREAQDSDGGLFSFGGFGDFNIGPEVGIIGLLLAIIIGASISN